MSMQASSNRRLYNRGMLRSYVSRPLREAASARLHLLMSALRYRAANPVKTPSCRQTSRLGVQTAIANVLARAIRSSTDVGMFAIRASFSRRGSNPILLASWMLKPGLAFISSISGPRL